MRPEGLRGRVPLKDSLWSASRLYGVYAGRSVQSVVDHVQTNNVAVSAAVTEHSTPVQANRRAY